MHTERIAYTLAICSSLIQWQAVKFYRRGICVFHLDPQTCKHITVIEQRVSIFKVFGNISAVKHLKDPLKV